MGVHERARDKQKVKQNRYLFYGSTHGWAYYRPILALFDGSRGEDGKPTGTFDESSVFFDKALETPAFPPFVSLRLQERVLFSSLFLTRKGVFLLYFVDWVHLPPTWLRRMAQHHETIKEE